MTVLDLDWTADADVHGWLARTTGRHTLAAPRIVITQPSRRVRISVDTTADVHAWARALDVTPRRLRLDAYRVGTGIIVVTGGWVVEVEHVAWSPDPAGEPPVTEPPITDAAIRGYLATVGYDPAVLDGYQQQLLLDRCRTAGWDGDWQAVYTSVVGIDALSRVLGLVPDGAA